MDINQVHDFLLDKYKVSRFTGRNSDKYFGSDYSMCVSQSHINSINKYGKTFVSWHECNQGLGFIIDDHCKQVCKEVSPFDPFATLHFYRYRNYNHRFVAHGKGRHYYTNLSVTNRYHIETVNSGEASVIHDVQFDTLAEAQVWCQQDYDKYYRGLSDAKH